MSNMNCSPGRAAAGFIPFPVFFLFSTSIAFRYQFDPAGFCAYFVPESLGATLFVDPQSRGTGSRNEFGAPDDVTFS